MMTDLSHLVQPGQRIRVRATPRASRNSVTLDGEIVRVCVTTAPENGKANAEVVRYLAKALGLAKTRLVLLQGATARDKLFRID